MNVNEQQARAALQELIDDFAKLSDEARQNMTEASVVRQFIDRLFRDVLGWPIEDPERYKYELSTAAGRPDITLLPEKGGALFVEAKRLGAIKDLEEVRYTIEGVIRPDQLSLPGMATDRTREEQQAINYAFQNGGTWAILTNFEKLRLFNAKRDWLVLSFERPHAYLSDFNDLWQLSYANIVNGSLDALSNQRLTRDVDTQYLDFINEARLDLAQNILARRDANPWVEANGEIDLRLLRHVVQRFLDRLVIIRFAEDHLVIPAGTLYQMYETRLRVRYVSLSSLLAQLFRGFDEDHNSMLFAPDATDRAVFDDDVLMPLVEKLYDARYRSMPADIIGNTYEQYLGQTLVLEGGSVAARDNLETRKKQGSYYTPQVIVRYLVDNSLGRYLYGTADGTPDGEPVEGECRKTSQDIRDLRVLDSACGSGSFLIYAYQVLADFYESEIARLEADAEARRQELIAEGVTAPLNIRIELTPFTAEQQRLRDYPRLILERHLYGVDLDPQAAEIATVNLMMRGMERRRDEKRLPLILNQNVKVGNGLIGVPPGDPRLADHAEELAAIRALRLELVGTVDEADHDAIFRELQAKSDALRAALDAELAGHFEQPGRVRPFHWAVEFPEAFVDADGQPLENPGFSVIAGNPPWEIVKPDLREYYAQFDPDIESKLTRRKAERRIAELNAEDPRREAGWDAQRALIEEQAAYFRAAPDFVQQGRGDTATHKLFLERMYGLLREGGRIGYIVPSGIYTDLGTKELREMFFNEGRVQYMYGLANVRGFFPDVDSRFKFTLLGVQKGGQTERFRAMFLLSHAEWPMPTENHDASAVMADVIYDEDRIFEMTTDLIERFAPNSLSMMEFQTCHDAEVAEKLYNAHPLIGTEQPETWNPQFAREFDMANDSDLFNQEEEGLPLYEGKMIHQFDAHFAEPRYWINEEIGKAKLDSKRADSWHEGYRFAFREIARSTDERTCIAAVLPPDTFAGHTLWVGTTGDDKTLLYYVSLVNSFCLDWAARFKVGTHVTLFVMKSLPLARLTPGDPHFDAIIPRAARLTCTRPEFAGLWESVMGESWDASKGAADPDERQRLRDEIDAIVAHLYGLSREDFDHILGTFPLVFPDTDAGRARRSALLRVYEENAL